MGIRNIAFLWIALLPLLAAAQKLQCTSGLIFGSSPSGNGKFQICQAALSDDPAMVATLDKLNQLTLQGADTRRQVERAVQALGRTSVELSPPQIAKLASSMADALQASARISDQRVIRELERMSIGLENLQERLAAAPKSDQMQARTNSAYAGSGGDAIARLDLDAANRIFDQIAGIDEHVKEVGREVRGLRDEAAENAAFVRLGDLARTKPKGELGQSSALRLLAESGRDFQGLDLSGLSFRGIVLKGMVADEVDLRMSDLRGAKLVNAHMSKSRMGAAALADADLSGVDLSLSSQPFIQAPRAKFESANLARSAWMVADLREANFRGADLRGANFEMADLRGADFRKARLQNAFFGGADLRGARFDDAEFRNTDAVAAQITTSTLTAEQRMGLCSSEYDISHSIVFHLYEEIPNQRTDSGFIYEDLLRYASESSHIFFPRIADKAFPRCKPVPKEDAPMRRQPVYDGVWNGDIQIVLSRSLLGISGRREDLLQIVTSSTSTVQGRAAASGNLEELAPLRNEQRRRLERRVAEIARDPQPLKPPGFENSQLILLAHFGPAILVELGPDWSSLAGDFSQEAWPRLYGDADNLFYSIDRNDATTAAFKAMVGARGRAWNQPYVVHQGVLVQLMTGSGYEDLRPVAERLNVALPRLAYGPALSLGGSRAIRSVLLWDETFEQARTFLDQHTDAGRGQSFNMSIRGVRLVETGSRADQRYLVWTARPLIAP